MTALTIDGNSHQLSATASLRIDVNLSGDEPQLVVSTNDGGVPLVHDLYMPLGLQDMAVVLRGPAGYSTFVFTVRDGDANQLLDRLTTAPADASSPAQRTQQNQQSQSAPQGEPRRPLQWINAEDGPWPRASHKAGDICTTIVPMGYLVRFKVVLVNYETGEATFIDPIIRNGNLGLRNKK